MSISLSSRIKFKQLCDVWEKIIKARASEKLKILQEFIQQYRKDGVKLKEENPNADISIFPVLRLFLPECDRERKSYNLKQKLLTNIYIRVLCLEKSSKDAQKMINYRIPTSNKSEGKSDLAEMVYSIVRKQLSPQKESLTIDRINKFLDDISKESEANKNKDELFKELFRQISALELKWVTRIILKDLKLGVGTKKLLQVYHPEAKEYFDLTSDLRKICDNLNLGIKSNEIQVFSFFKPMLLERLAIKDIGKLFYNKDEYFVQTKFDGERFQIHMKDGLFKYSTRQRYDMTNKWGFGKISSDGFLTSVLSRRLNPQCKSIILDGELMGWHKEKKKFGSKGMSYDVKKLTANSTFQPCFVAYDIILYNDNLLVNRPYKERLNILNNAFQDEEGSLNKCQSMIVSNRNDLLDIFNKSCENDEEGIVIKKSDSVYKPNGREGNGCYKLKAEYSEDLIQDIDLIILGGYYGKGLINSFMMGIAKVSGKEEEPKQFFSVVSVSSGISMNDLKELHSKFEKHWIKDRPNCIIEPTKDPPDVWIRPEDSLILTLRATEIVKSSNYSIGYTLRFPRVVKIRKDKPWYNVCTNTEFLSLIKNPGIINKLTKRPATMDDIETTKKYVVKPEKKPKLNVSKFEDFYEDKRLNKKVVPITRLLEGKEICVINGNDEISKEKIEETLLLHSATVVPNESNKTYCVIVGDDKKQNASNIIEANLYDVVTLEWFKRITKDENWGALGSFLPWDFLCIRETTKQLIMEKYDYYYDSYTMDADEESLKRSLKRMDNVIKDKELDFIEEQKLNKKLFNNEISPFSIFKQIIGYFKECSDSTKFQFSFMGGLIKEDIKNKNINYIFVEDNSLIPRVNETMNESMKVINSKWINDCFRDRKLYSINEYIIK